MAEIQVRRRTVLDSTRSSSSMALEWMKTSWTLTSTLFSFYLFILFIYFFFLPHCWHSSTAETTSAEFTAEMNRLNSERMKRFKQTQRPSNANETRLNSIHFKLEQSEFNPSQQIPMRMQWAEPSGQSDGFKHWELDWSVDWSSHGCRITTHRPFPGASSAASRRPSIPLNRVDTSSN